MKSKKFYSNGKLLLTGEYLVLNGAKSLAIPTKFGQDLNVISTLTGEIKWKSYDADGSVWFEDIISFDAIQNQERFLENKIKNTLVEILHHAHLLQDDFLSQNKGYEIETRLTFPRLWGLGTSSTLINNIAQWLEIDAFELLKNSFGGSGYDVACAQNNSSIIYHLENEKPIFESINFNPSFKNNLYFVYLNKKQNSKIAINNYLNKQLNLKKSQEQINEITKIVSQTQDIETFMLALQKHEIIISDILEEVTIKESFFPDFEGVIKSLGAWGGDFILVVHKENPKSYFEEKGFKTILSFEEMIL